MSDLDILFSAQRIGPRTAPNRLVAQPMEGGDGGEGGGVSARTLQRYERLADGGWGLVFVEAASVTDTSLGRLRGLAFTEATARSYEALVRGFRERNPQALLMIQLTHSGRQTHPALDRTSICPNPPALMRYLATEEIERIRLQFVGAALLAEKLGFDGLDLKLCNGYFGMEMLRPANTRADRWGGAFDNRTRFVAEAYQEIRSRLCTPGLVIGSRLGFAERLRGGFGTRGPDSDEYDPTEPLALIRLLHRVGADYVNITGEVTDTRDYADLMPEERRVTSLLAERLTEDLLRREHLDLTVIGSGYSELRQEAAGVAAARLSAGHTDLVGFGRQILADPLYPAKLRRGEPPDLCVGCWSCAELMLGQRRIGCVAHDRYYRRQLRELRREREAARPTPGGE